MCHCARRRKYLVPRRELFVCRKTVLVSRRKYLVPRRELFFVSKDSIGFPKEIFGSSKEVSQIRIRVRQMMYVDQFEVFCCTNRSIMAAQRSQTSRFNVGVSGRNSEPTIKQPKDIFSRKHRAHCLKAMPGYWCKIAKHRRQILLPEIVKVFTRTWKESNVAAWKVSIDK